MTTDSDPVRAYYASFAEREWTRLENPLDGAIEWALTTRRIARHLPPSSRILDIGGGPGRYAIWLADEGHTVSLADLSPELLDIARTEVANADLGDRVVEIVEADACDLARWPDATFDAALSLGPFYHLPDPTRREQAARELARVVRPGGVVFAMFMPRLTFLVRTIELPDERHHLADDDWLSGLVEDGRFTNDVPGRFNEGYGAHPHEVAPLMESAGFETIELAATESFSRGLAPTIADLATSAPDLHTRVIDLLDAMATEPSVLGATGHLLYIGRRA